MSHGRLLRCADTSETYVFTGHTFREEHNPESGLYGLWISELENVLQAMYRTWRALADHFAPADEEEEEEEDPRAMRDRRVRNGWEADLQRAWNAYALIGGGNAGGVPGLMLKVATVHGLEMDKEPHLLGCANGVLDLRTGALRDGRPEDRICLSVGYDFRAGDPSQRFQQEVVDRIFPVPEERAAMRKITAYFLYGGAPLKALFIATDVLGGYNAKSFWFYLVLRALGAVGGYGAVSDVRALLENGRSESASSHDEAGAQLKRKRFALCDEGVRGKAIDTNQLKSSTSGAPMPKAHRRCGERLTRADVWEDTAKLVLACNQEDMPKLGHGSEDKAGSSAVLDRIVYCPFRSKFVQDPETHRLEHPEHEHVFQADPSLALEDFRCDLINWALPAYRELHERGGGVATLDLETDIPQSFKNFKCERLQEQVAPPELQTAMKEFFETQFEPAADRPQRAQHMDHREYVQAAQFRKDFALTEEGAAFEAEAKSKRAYQTQFNECFKQIAPGRYADKPKTSHNKAVNKCLVGYKRKRRPPAEDSVPDEGTYP
jgi:phage/plasmid-associated DNA primase